MIFVWIYLSIVLCFAIIMSSLKAIDDSEIFNVPGKGVTWGNVILCSIFFPVVLLALIGFTIYAITTTEDTQASTDS